VNHVARNPLEYVEQTLDWWKSTRLALEVFYRVQTAHLQNGLAACFVPSQTATLVLLGQQIDVSRELVLEILIQFSSAEYGY
jgi:hypothetical protein